MAELYTTIEREAVAEFEEKKSVFIGHALPVKTEEEATAFVKELKNKYRDATHNVFAFVLGDGTVQRYSDDGEPQGTAGMPVLDVIRKSGCTDTAIVVTRYFGGTLLGAGGLVRAYSHAAKLALDEAHVITYEKYSVVKLVCSYSDYSKYLAETEKFGLINDGVDFAESVTMNLAVKSARLEDLEKIISDASNGRLFLEKVGERFDYR
ncbi:MAG: YigZ family protein [Ruminococcaceae bacterium]|nr:YigZ family protein [Oscillospiraceae bacterium]